MIYLVLGALAVATTGLLAWALFRRTAAEPGSERPDIDLYRDQLTELADEEAAGLIGPEDARSARIEVERRLLRATEKSVVPEGKPLGREGRTLTAAALIVLIPFSAAGIYLSLGSPDLPGHVVRMDAPLADDATVEELMERLARRLSEHPEDLEGWRLLGRTAQSLGRFGLAVNAFENAVRLDPDNFELYAQLGQSHVGANGGVVTPAARAAFEAAHAIAPKEPIGRYFLGLADYQEGDYLSAYHRWTDLAADTPPDAPWAEGLSSGIKHLEELLQLKGEAPPAPATAPGPTQEDVRAAQDMSEGDRAAMIRGMVDGLAARLEENPDDLDGWLRLGRAYVVLGEKDKAINAYRQVERLDPGNATAAAALADLLP